MTGCRHNAKNTLVKNYLHLAEQAGAVVHPLTTVTRVRPLEAGGYRVDTRWTKAKLSRRTATRTFTAEQVIFSAAALGTQKLLHKLKGEGDLPHVSDRLGSLTRTNSEAILGALAPDVTVDYSQGVAITSSFHPDAETHVEPVRYGKGSNAIGLLQTVLVDGGGRFPRWVKALGVIARNPAAFVRSLSVYRWSERTVIALVMQSRDNSIVVSGRRGRFGGRSLTSRPGPGEPSPTWIPKGHEAVRKIADLIEGDPGGAFTELVDIPMTAHFLGGCAIGATSDEGVVDAYHRVHGYPDLSIVDGSAVSANLGVNPSLTITAQAERAMALWPNKGEDDVRPAAGAPYRPVAPVPPRRPVVPASAPGALRLLPLTVVRRDDPDTVTA
jgi:cholesterol oxidase